MLFVENFNTDPYCNHALEEWLMENRSEDCFVLWRNQRAVLLGKNQNAYSEINVGYAEDNNVKIVRRITGGGAVYTDEGTVMFTFISGGGRLTDFRGFTEPIIASMRSLGVPAEFTGRNDLTINGMKFSGNAQCTYHGKLLHHGTLMYATDVGEMAKVLTVNELKLRDKGVASVRSRVTNISEHIAKPMNTEEFRIYLFNDVMKRYENALLFRLSDEDWAAVRQKSLEKHASPEWVFGHSRAFNIHRESKLSCGIVQINANVVKGRLESIGIYGDFFGGGDVKDIESALIGVLYEPKAVRSALAHLPVGEYIGRISLDEFIGVLF